MGVFNKLFGSESGDTENKVREHKLDNAKQTGDKYVDVGDGKHTHDSYTIDTSTGAYKEYGGGENSSDRSYNKS